MQVQQALPEHLPPIRRWLQESGSGFINNWNLISVAQSKGDLHVVVAAREPIAFCLATSETIDILEVRKEFRRKGVGRRLVSQVVEAACVNGALGIYGFCKPMESLHFWKKNGFEHVWDFHQPLMIAFPFRRRL